MHVPLERPASCWRYLEGSDGLAKGEFLPEMPQRGLLYLGLTGPKQSGRGSPVSTGPIMGMKIKLNQLEIGLTKQPWVK